MKLLQTALNEVKQCGRGRLKISGEYEINYFIFLNPLISAYFPWIHAYCHKKIYILCTIKNLVRITFFDCAHNKTFLLFIQSEVTDRINVVWSCTVYAASEDWKKKKEIITLIKSRSKWWLFAPPKVSKITQNLFSLKVQW